MAIDPVTRGTGMGQVSSATGDLVEVDEKPKPQLGRAVGDQSGKQMIVVAVDHSDPALWAVATGGKLALRLGARVLLVHVINPVDSFAPETHISSNYYTLLRQAAKAILDQAVTYLPAGIEVSVVIEEGDPALKVAALAQERGADYIVIGSHGRGRIGQLLVGSTATAVARLATCPVLVVSQPPEGVFAAAHKEESFGQRLLDKLNPAEVPVD